MTPSRPRRWLRFALKALGWIVLALLVLAVAALRALDTDWARERLRRYLVAGINSDINGSFSLTSIQGSLFGSPVLRGLTLRDAAGETVLHFGSIAVDYDLLSLFGDRLRVRRLQVQQPEIRIRITSAGRLNLIDLFAKKSGQRTGHPKGVPMPVEIESLSGIGGAFSAELPDGSVFSLADLHLEAGVVLDGLDAEISLRRADGRWDQTGLDFSARTVVRTSPGAVHARDLVLRTGNSSLTFPELRAEFGSGSLDAKFELALAGRDLARLTRRNTPGLLADLEIDGWIRRTDGNRPLQTEITGRLAGAELEIQAEIEPGVPAVGAKVQIENLDPSALVQDAPSGPISARLDVRLSGTNLSNLAGTLRGELSGFVDALAFSRCELDVSIDHERVSGKIELEVPQGRASVEGAVRLAQDSLVVESARVVAHLSDLGAMLPGIPRAAGTVDIDARARGPLDRLEASGTWRARDIRLRDLRVASVRGDFEVSGIPEEPEGRIEFEARRVAWGDVWRGPIQGRVSAGDLGRRIDLWLRAGGENSPFGGEAELAVRRDEKRVRALLRRLQLRTGPLAWTGHGGEIVLHGRDLEVRGLSLTSPQGRIRLDGRVIDGVPVQLRLIASGLDLAALGRLLPDSRLAALRGRVTLELSAGQIFGRPRLAVDATAGNLAWGSRMPALNGVLHATLSAGYLSSRAALRSEGIGALDMSLNARAPEDIFDPEAWEGFGPRAVRAARFHLRGLPIEPLLQLASTPAPVKGLIDARVEVGNRAEKTTVDLTLTDGRTPWLPRPLTAKLHATLAGGQIRAYGSADAGKLGKLRFKAQARAPQEAAAWSTLDGSALRTATVDLRDLDLAALHEVIPQLPEPAGSATARLFVSEGARTVTLDLTASQVRTTHLRIPVDADAHLAVDSSSSSLTFSSFIADMPLADGRLRLAAGLDALRKGVLPAVLDAAASGEMQLHVIPLPMVAEVIQLDRSVAGQMDGLAALEGSLRDPTLHAIARLDDVRIDDAALGQMQLECTVDRSALRFRFRDRQPEGGALDASGRLERADPGSIDVSLFADGFRLRPIARLIRSSASSIDFDGALEAEIRVRGNRSRPVPGGWVTVTQGSLRLTHGQRHLTDLVLTARLKEDLLTLDAAARGGSGKVAASVDAFLDDEGVPERATASLSTERFPIAAKGRVLAADLDAKLDMTRSGDLWKVRTDVLQGIIRLPRDKGMNLFPIGSPEDVIFQGEPAPEQRVAVARNAPGSSSQTIRMKILAPGNVTIRDEEVEAKLDVDLDITLARGQPSIQGTVEVVRGRLILFDRRYEIRRARTSFRGAMPPDPRFEVRLDHDFGNVLVTIHVQGTASRPKLFFTSEPPTYDQAQLLALVLGRDLEQPKPESFAIESQAFNAASGVLLSGLRRTLKKALPIDTLKLETDQGTEGRTAAVTVGKWITDNVFIAYRHRRGTDEDENVNEASFEYRLGRDWVIEGSYGDSGKGGVDILWVKRF